MRCHLAFYHIDLTRLTSRHWICINWLRPRCSKLMVIKALGQYLRWRRLLILVKTNTFSLILLLLPLFFHQLFESYLLGKNWSIHIHKCLQAVICVRNETCFLLWFYSIGRHICRIVSPFELSLQHIQSVINIFLSLFRDVLIKLLQKSPGFYLTLDNSLF